MSQLPPLEPDRLWQPSSNENGPRSSSHQSHDPLSLGPKPTPLSLFKVVGGSVIVAIFIVLGLVKFYGRDAQYSQVDEILISPQKIAHISFTDTQAKSVRRLTYYLDKILITLTLDQKVVQKEVSEDEYEELFKIIAKDDALTVAPKALEEAFIDEPTVLLTIYTKSKESPKAAVFQEVEFLSSGRAYRVSLREDGKGAWKYFRHIGDNHLALFLEKVTQ